MSILFKQHFQLAYVVDSVDAALAEWRDSYGITKWHVMDMKALYGEQSPIRYIALAWTDQGLMVELIEPVPGADSIYKDWRTGCASSRFHHLGFMIESDGEFAAVKDRFVQAGCPIATEGSAGDMLDFAYVDTTASFGHYCELIYLKGEGKTQFFADVPYN